MRASLWPKDRVSDDWSANVHYSIFPSSRPPIIAYILTPSFRAECREGIMPSASPRTNAKYIPTFIVKRARVRDRHSHGFNSGSASRRHIFDIRKHVCVYIITLCTHTLIDSICSAHSVFRQIPQTCALCSAVFLVGERTIRAPRGLPLSMRQTINNQSHQTTDTRAAPRHSCRVCECVCAVALPNPICQLM